MKQLDANLIACDVKDQLGVERLRVDLLMESLTLEGARLPVSLHRLEHLGDTFINLMCSLNAVMKRASVAVCNNYFTTNTCLYDIAIRLGLHHQLNGTPLDASWTPPTFPGALPIVCKAKHIADVVEAIVGAALVSGGETTGIQCLIALGLWSRQENSWALLRHGIRQASPPMTSSKQDKDAQVGQGLIAYRFKNLAYAVSTSLSLARQAMPLPELGRLLLCYASTWFLVTNFPFLTSHSLHHQKQFLSELLRSRSCPPIRKLQAWFNHVRKGTSPRPSKYLQVRHTKFLSEVLCAVFVDSSFSFSQQHAVFGKVCSPFIQGSLFQRSIPEGSFRLLTRWLFHNRCLGLEVEVIPTTTAVSCKLLLHGEWKASAESEKVPKALDVASEALLPPGTMARFLSPCCFCW